MIKIKELTKHVGLPTIIIGGAWFLIMGIGIAHKLSLFDMIGETGSYSSGMLSDGLKRFGRWGLLTLAMVPAIQSGVGPNFALPLGIVCGLLGQVCAFAWGFTGAAWVLVSIPLAISFALVMGYGYGRLMNSVKGSEMTIATYTGFSMTMLFSLLWLTLPFRDHRMTWPLKGTGLRQTIQLDQINGAHILDNFLAFRFLGISFPTGTLLVFFGGCFFMWLFMRSKTGIAISAGGSNPMFASAAGLNVNRGRIAANMVSTVLGALGIIIYAQSFGYVQLYQDPLMMAFPAVAGILIGGASVRRARIIHVLIGAFIFQGLMATSLPVANELFAGTDLSETLRMIIQNGIILYALTQAGGGKGK